MRLYQFLAEGSHETGDETKRSGAEPMADGATPFTKRMAM